MLVVHAMQLHPLYIESTLLSPLRPLDKQKAVQATLARGKTAPSEAPGMGVRRTETLVWPFSLRRCVFAVALRSSALASGSTSRPLKLQSMSAPSICGCASAVASACEHHIRNPAPISSAMQESTATVPSSRQCTAADMLEDGHQGVNGRWLEQAMQQ